MNLKLKRLVRTPSSEEYALFDLDQVTLDGAPVTIGKFDLHYTGEGVYVTILLSDEASPPLTTPSPPAFTPAPLAGIRHPQGNTNKSRFNIFLPPLSIHKVCSND